MQAEYRYEYLFPRELDEAIKKCPVFFVPTGLLEWHANHLPFGLDALKIHGICLRAAQKLGGGVVLPVNYFGTPGFSTYVGTLTYSEEILRPLFMAYMQQLKKVGAKVIALITGHYGDTQVDFIHGIGRDFAAQNPDVTIIARAEYEGVTVDGEVPADHGGKWETSMFMHLFPERLCLEEYSTKINDMKRYENAPFDYHKESAQWDFEEDVSKSASADLGCKAVEAITDLLVADIRKVMNCSIGTHRDNIVRLGACQTPEIIGNPSEALACMISFAKEAEEKNVDLLLFPECFLTGYILSETYMADYAFDFESEQFAAILKQLEHIKPILVFGAGEKKSGKYFNSAIVVNKGKIIGVYRKTHLIDPNELFFTQGKDFPIFELKGLKYGINICYDVQFADAAKGVADQDAQILLVLSQNMIRRANADKWKYKHNEIGAQRVKETGLWYVRSDVTGIRMPNHPFNNGVERISYGSTEIMNPKSEIVAQVPFMTIGMITVEYRHTCFLTGIGVCMVTILQNGGRGYGITHNVSK